ncbi:hypothetical protein DID73_01465 [Candidatus Marinamargulisbacteria bacterium SCGC AG-343-K17]|nr:hypothetical protein DID73_01465 [Candidatus Marinamargulisbacteria bacterium SCGC AG-343-K17]
MYCKESVKSFDIPQKKMSNYGSSRCQPTPQSSKALREVEKMIGLLNQVIDPYLYDPFCPHLFTSINEKITDIRRQVNNDPDQIASRLKDNLFNYFLTPIDDMVKVNKKDMRPSLFLADILTLIVEIEEHKNKHNKAMEQFATLPDDMSATDILINGERVTVTNTYDDGKSSYESFILGDGSYKADAPMMLLMDKSKKTNTLVSLDMFKGIYKSSQKNHPITLRSLLDGNMACMVVSPINDVRTCIAFAIPERLFAHVTMALADHLRRTPWLEVPKKPVDGVYLKNGKTAQDVCNEWMNDVTDAMEIRGLGTTELIDETPFNEDEKIREAFNNEGKYLVSLTNKTIQIARVFLRARLEVAALKNKMEIKHQIIFTEREFKDQLERGELDPLKEILAAYLEIIQIKTALHGQFNQPLPNQPLHLWELFQSLKNEASYV